MTLYLVATPIGNLEDITLRAIRILRSVPLVAAEDTRKGRFLLRRHGIETPVTSYYEHNKLTKLPMLLEKLAEGDLALISDAGTPGISDPGYELVVAAAKAGIPIVPIPGPSALVSAVSVAGLPTDAFVYLGFLPRKSGERRRALRDVAAEPRTLVWYEAPHRVRDTLEDILAELGDRPIAVCREMTKLYEEIWRGTVNEALAHFTTPRGEFVLVLGGRQAGESAPSATPALTLEAQIQAGLAAGESPSKLAGRLATQTGQSRRTIYQNILSLTERS